MSTYQPSFAINQASDATFRVMVAAIITGLTTVGLVQTADTGQINTGTVLAPTAANQDRGFVILRMADTLQGSYPVFIRFDFGSSGAAGQPAISIQCGTGTDGAGNLTGAGDRMAAGFASQNATALTQFFSGDTNRIVFMLRYTATAGNGIVFFVERLADSSGVDSNVGIVYGCSVGSAATITWTTVSYWGMQVIEFGSAIPAPYRNQITALPVGYLGTPTTSPITDASGASVYLQAVLPIGWSVHNPMRQLWAYLNGDTASMVAIPSVIYGTSRSLLPLGSEIITGQVCFNASGANSYTNTRLAMANW